MLPIHLADRLRGRGVMQDPDALIIVSANYLGVKIREVSPVVDSANSELSEFDNVSVTSALQEDNDVRSIKSDMSGWGNSSSARATGGWGKTGANTGDGWGISPGHDSNNTGNWGHTMSTNAHAVGDVWDENKETKDQWSIGQADSTVAGTNWGDGGNTNGGAWDGGDVGGQGAGDRACFNCGETGHNKAECPNPRKFTGTCRHCNEEGHMGKDCPNKPPMACKNCGQEGHIANDCKNPRLINRDDVEDIPTELAWKEIEKAARERDIDDCKEAIQKYLKHQPEMTYVQLQAALWEQDVEIFLIPLEKPLVGTLSNMDLQGNLNKKYSISYRFNIKPARPKEIEGWPKDRHEIIERLADAGEPVPNGLSRCSNCNDIGHISRNCPQEKVERTDRPVVQCVNCDEVGHRARDCTQERKDRFGCKNCGKSGHQARECPEPRSAEGVECRKCSEMGHFSKDCPKAGPRGCRNCGQEGHMAKDCTEPRNMDLVQCRNCEKMGHTSRDCTEPRNPKNVQCRNCDEMGHFSKDCPKPRDMSKVQCSNCGQMGHFKSKCTNQTVTDTDADGDGDGRSTGATGGDSWGAGAATVMARGNDNDGW